METFLTWTFPPEIRNLATQFFLWSGVAIWVGLIARVPFRGRNVVKGPWLTFCVGFVGSSLGPFVARAFFKPERFDPIGPAGLTSALAFAFGALTLFYVMSFLFPLKDDEYESSLDEDEQSYEDEEVDYRDERDEDRRRSSYDERRRREQDRNFDRRYDDYDDRRSYRRR